MLVHVDNDSLVPHACDIPALEATRMAAATYPQLVRLDAVPAVKRTKADRLRRQVVQGVRSVFGEPHGGEGISVPRTSVAGPWWAN